MNEIIKKHWFVMILSVFLFAFLIYFALDSSKTNVKGKKNQDGKDIIFSYEDHEYTADDLYDEVYKTLDIAAIIPLLELEVYKDALEVTPAMKADIKAQSENIILNLKNQYGEDWEFALERLLVQSGFTSKTNTKGLEEFLTIIEIRDSIEKQYVKDNPQVREKFEKAESPRLISHILIKMDDVKNPTKEELEKLEKAKAALSKEDAKFSEVAKEFSDDGSKDNGGSLGLVTKTSIQQFVENFQNQVYTVSENNTTEWFETEFGYHIIRVDADNLESLEKLNNYDYYKKLFEYDDHILLDITWDQINKQDIKFGSDDKLTNAIKDYYQPKEEN